MLERIFLFFRDQQPFWQKGRWAFPFAAEQDDASWRLIEHRAHAGLDIVFNGAKVIVAGELVSVEWVERNARVAGIRSSAKHEMGGAPQTISIDVGLPEEGTEQVIHLPVKPADLLQVLLLLPPQLVEYFNLLLQLS